jgi:hypothetical protein
MGVAEYGSMLELGGISELSFSHREILTFP